VQPNPLTLGSRGVQADLPGVHLQALGPGGGEQVDTGDAGARRQPQIKGAFINDIGQRLGRGVGEGGALTGPRRDRPQPADNRLPRQRELLKRLEADDAGTQHLVGDAGMFFHEQRREP
jgi:hypothetical protein